MEKRKKRKLIHSPFSSCAAHTSAWLQRKARDGAAFQRRVSQRAPLGVVRAPPSPVRAASAAAPLALGRQSVNARCSFRSSATAAATAAVGARRNALRKLCDGRLRRGRRAEPAPHHTIAVAAVHAPLLLVHHQSAHASLVQRLREAPKETKV
jgi:hypothetical protein